MSTEQTLIIIKPDGIAKGLVGKILRALQKHNLKVVDRARFQLEREWAEKLYDKERDEVYFKEVVEWITSAPVLLLKIEGDEAVDLVKWRIIGRYPEGIRGQYSENWIKNVAHAPDSLESAIHELQLAEPIFKKRKQMDETRFKNKMVFALTGMSECGKSTVGKYFNSNGIARLKIVRIFEKIRDKWSPGEKLHIFVRRQEEKDPYSLWDAFIDKLIIEMDHLNTNNASIESLYGGGLGPYLKQKLDRHFRIVFLDVPFKIRLIRQMQRENLPNIKSAEKYILSRDKIKEESGIPALKKIADEVIDNSGTLKELYQKIDQLIQKYLL